MAMRLERAAAPLLIGRQHRRASLPREAREALPGQILESRGQQRRIVERLRANDVEADWSREVAKADIDVIKDLDVVAEEPDGLDHDRGVAFLAKRGEGVLDRRADPGATGHALALEGEKPVVGGEPEGRQQSGHLGRSALGLHWIGVGPDQGRCPFSWDRG